MHLPRSPLRRSAAWTAAALVAAAVLTGPPAAAAGAVPTATVDSALTDAVDAGGEASFFVVLKDRADLSGVKKQKTHAAKARAAYKQLRAHADATQRSLTAFLDREKVGHEEYWIANAVKVHGGRDLVERLAKRADVASIVKEQHYALDDVEAADGRITPSRTATAGTAATADAAATPEWGIADINADDVWNGYDDRGEGIVIANVDSGVQFDHPDLVAQYRGNNGTGGFTHDYNWYDPTGECGTGGVPCDNNGHGTHTMGTMVGANGIGVAPNAKWIAAKGCESSSCSDESLLAARPVDPGADRPQRPEPASGPRAEHRQQLLGRRQHDVLPGHRRSLERLGHLRGLRRRQRR